MSGSGEGKDSVHLIGRSVKSKNRTCMAKTCLPQLEAALRKRSLVRFRQRYDNFLIRGYVLDIGPTFLLTAVVSDRIWFDGFECFRIRDVRGLMAEPYAEFVETALRKRRERIPKKPRVDVTTIEELLLTANRAFPLVTSTASRSTLDPARSAAFWAWNTALCLCSRSIQTRAGKRSQSNTD